MKLNVFCSPFNHDGYSIHSTDLLRTLSREGFDVACLPPFPGIRGHNDPAVQRALMRGLAPRPVCAAIKLDLGEPLRVATFSGSPRIFYTMAEVDRIPPEWVQSLNTVDEVWTPSSWGRNVFLSSGVNKPIRVIPEGVDPSLFTTLSHEGKRSDRYRFLAVGKFEERKNFTTLFRAYLEEFTSEEPVELMVHFGHDARCASEFLRTSDYQHALITFSSPVTSREEMVAFYHSADAFVLPTRGEGWGLPIVEAMCCGLPVITTGIGPMLEYASSETALLLDYELVQARDPHFERFNQWFKWGRWAEPGVAQLRRFMRQLFENPERGREMGRRAAEQIRSNWTWNHAVIKIRDALRAAGVQEDANANELVV